MDKIETSLPGRVFADYGQRQIGCIPWDVGGLYYRHNSTGHAGLMGNVIDHLLPGGRQLKTSAHPVVEIHRHAAVGTKADAGALNLGGHSATAYFATIEMRDYPRGIAIRVSPWPLRCV